ncbi:MAG: acyl-CoA carboxylase subunit beta [Candidatus Binatia bacterium]
MSWESELEELHHRRELALRMGGEERVARQHAEGKKTVRERIHLLLDPGSFHEIGTISGKARYEDGRVADFSPANFIFGTGTIEGRRIVVAGDDFTVRGGSAEASKHTKQVASEQLARDLRVPIVRLVDGSGGGGSVRGFGDDAGYNRIPAIITWGEAVAAMGEIPVVAAALGSVAGLGAAKVAASHFSVMVKGSSQVLIAGPPLVRYATHEDVDKEALGGSHVHTRNGVVDNEVETEEAAIAEIHRFLSYVPQNAWMPPPVVPSDDDPRRREEALLSLIPRERRRVYKVRTLIELVVDKESFFEKGRYWGRSLVTGLARADGYPVGVVANDPMQTGGALTADGARKLEAFVDFCDTFHFPVVNFLDQPGFAIGTTAEKEATIRAGVKMMAALQQSTIPWITFVIRRVYGVAGAAHRRFDRFSPRYAWPSGAWGSLPLEGGIEAAYRRQLDAAEDAEKLRAELVEKHAAQASPFRSAEAFDIEEIIDPRDTRPIVCEWVRDAYAASATRLGPKMRGMRP